MGTVGKKTASTTFSNPEDKGSISSETPVSVYNTIRYHNTKDHNMNNYRFENLIKHNS
jgi:hypothetical protein